MRATMQLTPEEIKWVESVQKVLDKCPSKRLGFFTVGDSDVHLYDKTKDAEIETLMSDRDGEFFCGAVNKCGADFDTSLTFPSNVEATAG